MTEQEIRQQILRRFYSRLAADPAARAALRRIDKGKATLADTAALSDRAADLLGEVFGAEVLDIPEDVREAVCEGLLREQYDSTMSTCDGVLEALDSAQGLHLTPQHPGFPLERVQQLASSLNDPNAKPETIRRRASKPVATVAKSFHDSYIRINAQTRHDLGIKCYLDRVAAPGCCAWCTGIAGRYVYGDHPKDIFRRHDNCSCTVTFENGRQRQDVWSKRTWEADPEEVMQNASEPTVLSQDAAESLQNAALGRLTKPGGGDIMEEREAQIRTIEDAKNYLGSVFSNVKSGVFNLDEQLIIDNTEQLRKLNERFGVLSSNNGGALSCKKMKSIAETLNHASSADNSLTLSTTYYQSENNLIAVEKLMQEVKPPSQIPYSMPVADEYLSVATITHEYGHMLENEIIRNRIDPKLFIEYQQLIEQGASEASAGVDLGIATRNQANKIYDEIVAIAKEINPEFSSKNSISKYGTKNYLEAFAEIFMNSQCGAPNEFGEAMNIFLERSGY